MEHVKYLALNMKYQRLVGDLWVLANIQTDDHHAPDTFANLDLCNGKDYEAFLLEL